MPRAGSRWLPNAVSQAEFGWDNRPVQAQHSVQHYENFPVASWLCPPALRQPIRAIYRFARVADDLADEGDASAEERLASLGKFRDALSVMPLAPDAACPSHWAPLFSELALARSRHPLDVNLLHDLLSAFEQDVVNPDYQDRAQLLDYCRRSANPVGRLLLQLHGVDEAAALRASDAICSALQLINFWQDLGIDLARGRCYVPRSDMALHGVQPGQWPKQDNDATRALTRALVAWARQLMQDGAWLPTRLPGRAGWELRLVVQGGLCILDKIERGGWRALTHRPTVSKRDALPLLWRAWRMPTTPPLSSAEREAA